MLIYAPLKLFYLGGYYASNYRVVTRQEKFGIVKKFDFHSTGRGNLKLFVKKADNQYRTSNKPIYNFKHRGSGFIVLKEKKKFLKI